VGLQRLLLPIHRQSFINERLEVLEFGERSVYGYSIEVSDRKNFLVSYRYSGRGYPDIVLYNNPKTVIRTSRIEGSE
jgi:hypothetical protein